MFPMRRHYWNDIEFLVGMGIGTAEGTGILLDYPFGLMLKSNAIAQMQDEELVALCRWFQEHSHELYTLESICAQRGYDDYGYGEANLLKIAYTSSDPDIRADALQLREEIRQLPNTVSAPATQPRPSGYVYVVEGGGYYKIGVTSSVDRRMAQLSVQPPFDLEVICTIETDDMYALEAELHETFADKHVKGEWFALDEEDIEWLMNLSSS